MAELTKQYNDLNSKFNADMDAFSNTLQNTHISDALVQLDSFHKLEKKVLKHEGFKPPKPSLHTVEVFKKGFAFPQIALNDFAREQLDVLSEAEKKLTKKLDDQQVLSEFLVTANVVAEKLQSKYKN